MTNSNLIYIGIAGIGIAMIFTVGIGTNLLPLASAGVSFPVTECEQQGGEYDHWDKVIFTSEGAALRNGVGTFIPAGTVLEYKFPQTGGAFNPIDLAQFTADHLNFNIGWRNGGGNLINPDRLVIIDVEYSVVCIFPQPVP